jgi:hypothetical protein
MDEIRCGDQAVLFDLNLARTAYSAVPSGDAERGGCLYCLNFAAQRSSVYPNEFRSLLEQIGIDPEKEGERNLSLDNFEFWFANAKQLPKPAVDFGPKVAAVEFITKLPWALAEQPEPA